MKNIIVWFRNDLRVHDHPALARAATDGDHVIPVFIFDTSIYKGKHASSNRNRFLLECLDDLKSSLQTSGADLIIREGNPAGVLESLAKETKSSAIYYTADYTPISLSRDKNITSIFDGTAIEFRSFPGKLIVSSLDKIRTKSGTIHKVFTPFWKSWMEVGRRERAETPTRLSLPSGIKIGTLPTLDSMTIKSDLSPTVRKGGETAALKHFDTFLKSNIDDYHQDNNDMALDNTSRLSPYFHFGCLSPLAVEVQLPDTKGARAWRRQLAWREFYHYVLFYNPSNSRHEFQEKYRSLAWDDNPELLAAWQQGKTGYPIVDAAMRQLNSEGWMHNRARLIVGSFLTKDLWIDWRLGESYFMKMLLDGDQANNNGNWQWIASVGVDPAPVYRRLYNPTLQQKNFDPTGRYVRKYVPELQDVPDKYLAEPWTMPSDIQQQSHCVISKDYPLPIVDHKAARVAALEKYRSV